MASNKDVVLVTGSSGCLGQHIVRLLQEHDERTTEIRLFDKTSYANKLGHSEEKKMIEFVADIRNTGHLLEAMEGVNCVIHTAAQIDLRLIPDNQLMESVNIDGTQTVIDACLKKNVPRLVLASSSDSLCERESIIYGSENTTPVPKRFMHRKYGESKWKSEDLIMKASGQLCSDGKTFLRTVSIITTAFYGEEDKYFVTPFLKSAKSTNGCHYRVKRCDERLQFMYVGNAAWAFVKAKDKLAVDETISGEAFYITDDTKITDVHEFIRPYLEALGFRVSPYAIPYWLAWTLLSVICLVLKMINIVVPVYADMPDVLMFLKYFCTTFTFDRTKAVLRLDYQPLYTPEEARSRSLRFYKTVKL